jgi:toxin ParE1/3/4
LVKVTEPEPGRRQVRRLEITPSATRDLDVTLEVSASDFGPQARRRYETLIERALGLLRSDPDALGSLDRPELGAGVRTFHLRFARGRASAAGVGRPRHLIVYESDDARVLILRVLHDAMDLARHLPGDDTGG